MALMTAAIYCAPVILIWTFDRYLVPLAPLLAFLASWRQGRAGLDHCARTGALGARLRDHGCLFSSRHA